MALIEIKHHDFSTGKLARLSARSASGLCADDHSAPGERLIVGPVALAVMTAPQAATIRLLRMSRDLSIILLERALLVRVQGDAAANPSSA